jgi:hypothetical protein
MFYREKYFSGAYVHHLEESKSLGALSPVNEFNCRRVEYSYAEIVRNILDGEIEKLKGLRRN